MKSEDNIKRNTSPLYTIDMTENALSITLKYLSAMFYVLQQSAETKRYAWACTVVNYLRRSIGCL